MINFYDQVPAVYTNASRDFQYLSWLINIVLNNIKHNVDHIYTLPNAPWDSELTELLAMTLGFKVKRNYDIKQLAALVAILPSVLRYKGTERAIKMAASALVIAAGSLGEADAEINGMEVRVVLPQDLADITLFLDLLDYILPAGMTCRIVRRNETKKPIDDIEVLYKDELKFIIAEDFALDNKTGASYGLSSLYELSRQNPDITANILTVKDAASDSYSFAPNIGLLDTAIIPTFDGSRLASKVVHTVGLYSTEVDSNGVQTHKELLAETDNANYAEKLLAPAPMQEL